MAKHYKTVVNESLIKSGWTIAVCQSVSNRENVSEYVLKVEAEESNVTFLMSVFILKDSQQGSRVMFCQRDNGIARVLRKRCFYTDAKVIPFHRVQKSRANKS